MRMGKKALHTFIFVPDSFHLLVLPGLTVLPPFPTSCWLGSCFSPATPDVASGAERSGDTQPEA